MKSYISIQILKEKLLDMKTFEKEKSSQNELLFPKPQKLKTMYLFTGANVIQIDFTYVK